jgi:uncharacterized RDD family membrane protein YckC
MYKKQIVYAGLSARCVAALIDCLIVLVIITSVLHLLLPMVGNYADFQQSLASVHSNSTSMKDAEAFSAMKTIILDQGGWKFILKRQILYLLLISFYIMLCWWKFSASIGKICLATRIVDAETLGKPSMRQYLTRLCCYPISMIPLGIGFIAIAFDKRCQAWHDRIAGTIVIKK